VPTDRYHACGVVGVVDTLLFLVEVPGPVIFEVAVDDQCAEFEDGFGAPIGSFLVAAGFAIALGTTGVIYVVGAVLLLVLVGNFTATPTKERQPINVEIRDGLTFLWRHKLLAPWRC
jgi:hypothetical protein